MTATTGPGRVVLVRGREKSVLRRHPWVFSGALSRVEGDPGPGSVVRVTDSDGAFLAWGQYSPSSRIRVRLLEWEESDPPGRGWWHRRLASSLERRGSLFSRAPGEAFRLVHGEADFLPGVVVDRYGDFLVLQLSTAGADRERAAILSHLVELASPRGVFERSDVEARRLEGLDEVTGLLYGEPPPGLLETAEGSVRHLVDVRKGQKTGAYLDQRANRDAAAAVAGGREVLDAFSYTGGFAIGALRGGASSAVLVDSSAQALAVARRNLELNGLAGRADLVEADVFHQLRRFRDQGRSFDMVVLDPPKLAPMRSQAAAASRAYKDLNLLAMKLLRREGILVSFSCSGAISATDFRTILSWAALDAGREVQVLQRLSQGWDHPVRLSFPEAEYLKGLLCLVL